MQVSSRWRVAAVIAGALVVGAMAGPTVVQAASAGLVQVEGAHGHEADVSSAGRLSVNAGLSTTAAGQLEVAEANPSSEAAVFHYPTCAAGGIYTIPAGKALIITTVNFYLGSSSATSENLELDLQYGTRADPCKHEAASGAANTTSLAQNEVFEPGIPIPAGSTLGLNSDASGSVEFYGYLVPASAVPASIGAGLPAIRAGGLTAIRPAGR
jgi:hypothetical protein